MSLQHTVRRDGKRKSKKKHQEHDRIIQEKFLEERNKKPPLQAKNPRQQIVIDSLKTKQVVVVNAPAGFGKTHLITTFASDALMQGRSDKLILSRPSVGMGKNTIGLLKGTMRDKFEPYLMPILEVFWERWGRGAYETGLSNGSIEFAPLEYLRGRNFKGVTIIDEAQLVTPSEMYTILTRLHQDGKLYLIGDSTQNDLKGLSGIDWLIDFIARHGLEDQVAVIKATSDDIVRGSFCKAVVKGAERDIKEGFKYE